MPFVQTGGQMLNLRERQKKLREQYTDYHPILCYPGWLMQSLPRHERRALSSPDAQSSVVDNLATEIRLVRRNGVELRLSPRPYGLRMRWFYHVPHIIAQKGATCLPFEMVIAGQRHSGVMGSFDRIIPWHELGPAEDASAHEIIDYHSQVAEIPADNSELNVRYLPIDCVKGAHLRMPHFDLVIGTSISSAMVLDYIRPSDEDPIYRKLRPETRHLSHLPQTCMAAAAKYLTRECSQRAWHKRVQIEILNAKAIAGMLCKEATSLAMGPFKSKPNKEQVK